jgi:hypothetical protein
MNFTIITFEDPDKEKRLNTPYFCSYRPINLRFLLPCIFLMNFTIITFEDSDNRTTVRTNRLVFYITFVGFSYSSEIKYIFLIKQDSKNINILASLFDI